MNPCPALFNPLPASVLTNNVARNVPNNMLTNPHHCFLTSLWIVSLTPFNNKSKTSKDLTYLITSPISSLDIVSVIPDSKILICIPASAADADAVNPNGSKTLLANGLIAFFIYGYPVFNNAPRSPPDCIILDYSVFDSMISVDMIC